MSAKVDQFCDRLRDQLNALEERLQTVRADMQALPGEAEKALQARLEEARTKLEAQKEYFDQTRANVQAWAKQKLAETTEAVGQWQAKRETHKLNARADRAEAYSAAAIALAAAMIDEAEAAILDAVVARRDADAAQQSATPAR